MDLLFSIVGGCVLEFGKCICGCIYPKIKSIAKFQSNLYNLIKDTESLVNLRNSVKENIELAENDGYRPRPAVVEWLEKVEAVEKEVNMIRASIRGDGDGDGDGETLCNRCRTCCLCSIPVVRVAEKLKEVKGLIETGSFSSGGLFLQDRQAKKVELMTGPSIEGLSTASKNLCKVLQLLDDDDVSRIGVCGMGGVGKTTLVKNLNNKPNLEELILVGIRGVEIVSEFIDLFHMEFPKLKVIRVSNCYALINILSVRGSNLNMQNLEEITVVFCDKLQQLFFYSDLASRNSSHVSFPKLRILKLEHLPKLKTLGAPSESWQSLEELQVIKCNLLKKLHLSSKNAETIKEIRGESRWWNQLEWDEEDTKSILQHCFIPDDY